MSVSKASQNYWKKKAALLKTWEGKTLPLCACGCGQTVGIIVSPKKAGQKAGSPRAVVWGHKVSLLPKYEVDPITGCWNWMGCLDIGGYGVGRFNNRQAPAHHATYIVAKGPIPPELQLDHLCRNRRCVNPDHLEAVTPMENVRRGNVTKLTIEKVREVRALFATGESSKRAIAEKFGVSASIISLICSNKRWPDPQQEQI